LRFGWNDKKNASNQWKHRVSFETAARVFRDPMRITIHDREVDGEDRWHTIGLVDGTLMLLVVHTIEDEEEEIVRIISARKAIARERRKYEEEI
jgi:uncharacterized protein